ncbi:MAG TPA: response regulator transcription factor [Dehalococcoidia bacterium]|nr:response regulator transcription factor [Dehalococcoidia bacterium]
MSGARVLVIDDEPQVLRLLRTSLTERGYDVATAPTGEEAMEAFGRRLPDVIILDLVMPGMSGLDVCRALREQSAVPVIVLSAHGDERDKVLALDLGADDYLTKPFGMEELLARIRVALRHSAGGGARTEPVFQSGDLRIDFEARRVWRGDVEVRLTPTEYELLKFLVQHSDKALTHGMILRTVWGADYAGESQYLRVYIPQLRRKLEKDPTRPRFILTEPGVGYRFQTQEG